jgi:hypothetical protein
MSWKTFLFAILSLVIVAAAWYGVSRWAAAADKAGNVVYYEQGWAWLLKLLAYLAIFAGAFTLMRGAGSGDNAAVMATRTMSGIAGILAGATLLEIGDWYVPAALAVVVVAAAIVAVVAARQPSD